MGQVHRFATGTICAPGTSLANGWDGAPQWATLFDPGPNNENTCTPGSREDSSAAQQSWDNFYADTDGIQSQLVDVWRVLANAFAHEPAVAGYDLLNEPNLGTNPDNAVVQLGIYFDRAITAIRAGEQDAGGFSHMAIFETTVVGTTVPYDFTDDDNIVFSGHNYGDSITPLPMDVIFNYFDLPSRPVRRAALDRRVRLVQRTRGEPGQRAEVRGHRGRDGARQRVVAMDPGVRRPALHRIAGGHSAAPAHPLQGERVPGRRRPRPGTAMAAGGHTLLSPCRTRNRRFTAERCRGVHDAGGRLSAEAAFDVWVPDRGVGAPAIGGTNIADVDVVQVDGGWRVLGVACDTYTITVNLGTAIAGECELASAPDTQPAAVTPRFTG